MGIFKASQCSADFQCPQTKVCLVIALYMTVKELTLVSSADPAEIKKAVVDSIEKLGGKPDMFLIHNPFVVGEGNNAAAWQVLEGLVADGTLGGVSLGVSNFRPQDLEEVLKVAKIKPVVNRE